MDQQRFRDDYRNYKRPREDNWQAGNRRSNNSMASIVANHYNSINNNDISERMKSRIYFMRNFNNWVKSIIIRDTIQMLRNQPDYEEDKFIVHDLACGKGGDLIKYQKSEITHLVGSDIAHVSIKHCQERYIAMRNNFSAQFIHVDCTRELVKDHLADPEMKFDMTSCQFSLHYCFESFEQAKTMIRNASETLKVGGIFCGTIPDSSEIIKRLNHCGTKEFGNDVYSIQFDKTYEELVEDEIPLFGTKYNFHLVGVVDCPEFLVYFPAFEEICRSYGLELIFKKRFDQFFHENKDDQGNARLLNYMDALEKYPAKDNEHLMGKSRDDYKHVREYMLEAPKNNITSLGTLSKSEWEAVTLYLVFSFRKVSDSPI